MCYKYTDLGTLITDSLFTIIKNKLIGNEVYSELQ